MKMIIVLDKICLMGVIAVSLCVGFKMGEVNAYIKTAKDLKTVNVSDINRDNETRFNSYIPKEERNKEV